MGSGSELEGCLCHQLAEHPSGICVTSLSLGDLCSRLARRTGIRALKPPARIGVLQTPQMTAVVLWSRQVGDQILEVNGRSFLNILHDEAVRLLKSSQHLILTVKDVGRLPHARTTVDETKWIASSRIGDTATNTAGSGHTTYSESQDPRAVCGSHCVPLPSLRHLLTYQDCTSSQSLGSQHQGSFHFCA